MLYLLVKFLHVVFAAVWIGGAVTLTLLGLAVYHAQDVSALRTLARYTMIVGARVFGPVAALTVVTGLGAMLIAHI